MKYLYIGMMLMIMTVSAFAGHDGHTHKTMENDQKLELNPERFDKFRRDLSHAKIVVVTVKGMVCDFCARGIEKTLKKDKTVQKVDVDLDSGKVIIAYNIETIIDFEDIKQKILASGQNAVNIQVLEAW